jgi:phosphatidylglycerophosphate synthase
MAERGLGNSVQVGFLGKVKTTFQMLSIAMLLMAASGPSQLAFSAFSISFLELGKTTLFLATLFTAVSGVQYFIAGVKALENANQSKRRKEFIG